MEKSIFTINKLHEKAKKIEGIFGQQDSYVVLCSGQSNALGRGRSGNLDINSNVKIWHIRNARFEIADFANKPYPQNLSPGSRLGGGRNNAALAFCKRLQQTTDKPVYLIVNARGNQKIKEWGNEGTFTDTLKTTVDNALDTIGRKTIDCYIWLQGESDLRDGETYEHYSSNFEQMIDNMNAASWFSKTNTPVLTVPINQDYIDNPDKGVTLAARGVQRFLSGLSGHNPTYGRTNTASPENLPTFDDVHYTGQSLFELGYSRLFSALLNINDKARIHTPSPKNTKGSGI